MWRLVDLVRIDVSEERIASIFKVEEDSFRRDRVITLNFSTSTVFGCLIKDVI
jgi:hypothetical protein